MKKVLLFAALCIAGVQGAFAQQTDSLTVHPGFKSEWGRIYLAGGVATSSSLKLNDKLTAQGLPEVSNTVFEISIGTTRINGCMLADLEWNTDYFADQKTTGERVHTVATGIKYRPQYIFFKRKGMFAAAGFDISFMYNKVDIYTRGNTIDLNSLDPATHSGHISLYNKNCYLGPSASFGVLQHKENALRLATGYEWNIARASWHSEYASVTNTVKEGGQGRFYAKVIWNF
ncbi:hypothetical protein ACLI1A_08940 [Flavobacterium sp. RHBU_3]|uniref:hypothetical protein n=1 Tax=Flavobacterium sp. RHBU_3 TaxID=3391184 RepID=UPI0039852980